MIPSLPPEAGKGGARAERAVFDALKTQLTDAYYVYSRLSYIDDRRHTQGEVDFLVLHPTLGMLVLECKGEGVRRKVNGDWERMVNDSWQPMKEGPFAQAERTKYELVDKLKPRAKKILPKREGFPFVYGHGVIFPLSHVDDTVLPLHHPRTILFDADDLQKLATRIPEAMDFWRTKAGRAAPDALDPWELKRFRKKALHPQL
ncbi:MAG: NERD domain-containing protein, partial [Deltaproteobacteria bacterium]|nr:NERD domain-containing protein [Deltaproteobacteria bacterium]